MIYYNKNGLTVRKMCRSDADVFVTEEIAQGWHPEISKYLTRLKDMEEGNCIALTAEFKGEPAGYVNVYFDGKGGIFGKKGIPEIVDFGVLEKYRRRGIGSVLMDTAEQIAKERSDVVYLAVGLHGGYGSAQRMYVKRGYLPDGTGAWYGNKPCEPYEDTYPLDDDLVLYLSKKLR